jgi:tripartite-type tricarboxylate transporter receptor subunit TctC
MLAALAGLCAVQQAMAQGYPSKPIRLIRPHPAGGPSDVTMRALGQILSETLGQPIVVENRVGAEGIIGAEACIRAPADGYTLCGTDSWVLSLNPVVRLKLPYEPLRDFAPIAHLGFMDSAMLVQPSMPVKSIAELVEYARARPGQVTFGSWGPGGASYIYIQWLKNAKGALFLDVPYKSAGQAVQGVVAGQVQVATYSLGLALPMVKAGKLKALAMTGEKRSSLAPQLPTFKESGMEMSLRTWYGILAPVGAPGDIVQRLNAEITRIQAQPEFKEKYVTAIGIELVPPAGGTPAEFAAFMRADREMYANIVKTAGIKPE